MTNRDKYYLNPSICKFCNNIIYLKTNEYCSHAKQKQFCDWKCFCHYKQKITHKAYYDAPNFCKYCDKLIKIKTSQTPRETKQKTFCNSSCAAKYNNIYQITGNCRSLLEVFLEEKLINTFPKLKIVTNSRAIIGLELDFYFPTLSLAIEINGIFHYKPIFGIQKLTNIQNNDKRKLELCHKHAINLIVIPTLESFSNKIGNQYLSQVIQIVTQY